jgi:hypothetical protein
MPPGLPQASFNGVSTPYQPGPYPSTAQLGGPPGTVPSSTDPNTYLPSSLQKQSSINQPPMSPFDPATAPPLGAPSMPSSAPGINVAGQQGFPTDMTTGIGGWPTASTGMTPMGEPPQMFGMPSIAGTPTFAGAPSVGPMVSPTAPPLPTPNPMGPERLYGGLPDQNPLGSSRFDPTAGAPTLGAPTLGAPTLGAPSSASGGVMPPGMAPWMSSPQVSPLSPVGASMGGIGLGGGVNQATTFGTGIPNPATSFYGADPMTGGIGGGPISEGVWKNSNRPADGSFGTSATMENHALALMEAQHTANKLAAEAILTRRGGIGQPRPQAPTQSAIMGLTSMPRPVLNPITSSPFQLHPYGMNVGFGSNF